MFYMLTFFLICTTPSLGIKVSMEGSLNLGKEVLEALSEYLGFTFRGSRRSLLPAEEDPLSSIVRASFSNMSQICETESCENLKKFIGEYTIILAKTLKSILEKAFTSDYKENVYLKQVENYLTVIKEILTDKTVDKEKDTYFWLVVLKKINSKFRELASIYETNSQPENNVNVKRYIQQKIILALVIIETNYANTLCIEYNICMRTTQVTDILLAVAESLINAPDEKVRKFIRALYKALFDTTFYSQIDESTAHHLQVFIYDMIDSKESPAKKILLDIQENAKEHLKMIKSNKLDKLPDETRLVHAILSDLDLIYVIQNSNSFTEFLKHFYDFLRLDLAINSGIQNLLVDIKKVLSDLSSDYFNKLVNEVRVLINMIL